MQPQAGAVAYSDSTPHLHIGDSAFEDWYQNYLPNSVGHKQIARDAYAAGMGDPLVTAAPGAAIAACEQEAECEALREDAARFAWLLDNANIDFDPSEPYQLVIWEPGTGDDWKSIVRAAIDAARAAADQGGA